MPLLEAKNIKLQFNNSIKTGFNKKIKSTEILYNVGFSIEEGEIFGLVGESGSGKSMTALSLLGLLPEGANLSAEKLNFNGKNLLIQTEQSWQELRGKELAMVFQEPMTSLNPVSTIESQVGEGLLLHGSQEMKRDKAARRERILEVLSEAGLPDAEGLLDDYPHRLSGGMRQRVMIAIAMLCRPRLLIADEPTTALDAATQEKILELLLYYRKAYHTSILFISHDLRLIRRLCDRVAVMKDGRIVETARTEELFSNPQQEYTKQLLQASNGKILRREKGMKENHEAENTPRLQDGGERGKTDTEDRIETGTGRARTDIEERTETEAGRARTDTEERTETGAGRARTDTEDRIETGIRQAEVDAERVEADVVLTVWDASLSYIDRNLFGKKEMTDAFRHISFELHPNEILGLVGESGSGKSSLSKAITGLVPLTSGSISIKKGFEHPQMVFQDPYGSLNPAKKIGWILEEPLKIQGGCTKEERRQRVLEALAEVELLPEHAGRYVRELSGGQRQRVAIAAALITKPKLVILDEPVSALDVTVQGQILALLYRLQQEHGMSYLFVSHDMRVVQRICSRVMILYRGELVEYGETEEVFQNPKHEYTKELLRGAGIGEMAGKEIETKKF